MCRSLYVDQRNPLTDLYNPNGPLLLNMGGYIPANSQKVPAPTQTMHPQSQQPQQPMPPHGVYVNGNPPPPSQVGPMTFQTLGVSAPPGRTSDVGSGKPNPVKKRKASELNIKQEPGKRFFISLF